ncbi:MAG: hypothetical protein E3J56_09190 [Candidatus Aminicenantes bacterium]|nr:MAG: hypothetical protein E3J56_09190 [Candidatus Aminicenantes bacterium]
MKINLKDIQTAYEAYRYKNIPMSRSNCPSFKKLISFFTSTTSDKQKIKIVDHVTNCHFCAQEFQFIICVFRFERKLNKELCRFLQPKKEMSLTKRNIKQSDMKSFLKQKIIPPFLSWKYAIPLLGIAITILALSIFQNFRYKEYRTIDTKRIQLIEPINMKYSKSSLVFKWNEYKGSNYYLFELFDKTLLSVWKSDKIFRNFISLPNEEIKDLDINKKYYWMINAFLPSGKKVESDMAEFILID